MYIISHHFHQEAFKINIRGYTLHEVKVMYRKIFCTLLIGLSLSRQTIPATFNITANSNNKEDIEIMYQYKNEIIKHYQDMITGMDEEDVLKDMVIIYPNMYYENHQLYLIIGEGQGKTIKGELKKDYCEVEIKPKSIFEEWLD